MTRIGQDTLNSAKTLDVGGKTYHYYDINAVADKGWGDLSKLPFSLKVLLENLLRHEDGESVTVEDIEGPRDGGPIQQLGTHLGAPDLAWHHLCAPVAPCICRMCRPVAPCAADLAAAAFGMDRCPRF